MNQLRVILLGLALISGAIFTPYSFAQTDYTDGPYSSFFQLLKYLFSSEDIVIITNSGSIIDFDKAVIIHTSSITRTNHTEDQTDDETKDETHDSTKDKDNDKTKDKIGDFNHGTVHVSSETAVSKVTLCHVPPGNPSKAHSITVASPSVSAHLDHGDYLGACGDSDDHPILHFGKSKVITSSNTGVVQLYNKILDLKSNPSISLENLKKQVLSVANLYQFLVDADKQDRKEFQELFHDYKEIVKQLLEKSDEQSKHAIETILEQAQDAFNAQHNHEKDQDKESNHQDKESNHQDKESNHQDKTQSNRQNEDDNEDN